MEEASGSDSLRLRNSGLAVVTEGAFSLREREEYRDKGMGDGGTSTKARCLDIDMDPDMEATVKVKFNTFTRSSRPA
jgi:hypothetical protein